MHWKTQSNRNLHGLNFIINHNNTVSKNRIFREWCFQFPLGIEPCAPCIYYMYACVSCIPIGNTYVQRLLSKQTNAGMNRTGESKWDRYIVRVNVWCEGYDSTHKNRLVLEKRAKKLRRRYLGTPQHPPPSPLKSNKGISLKFQTQKRVQI